MAHLVLVITLLIWSFSFLAAARLRQDLGLVDALGARFLPVLLGAGLLLLWRRPLRLPRTVWWRIIAMGILGVPVYNLAFLHGLKTVPTGTASLIIALNPVFTAVIARLVLKERLGLRRAAGLVLSLAGVFVVPYAMRTVDCLSCGARVELVPWAEGRNHLTKSYAWFLAGWAKRMGWSDVTRAPSGCCGSGRSAR